MLLSIGMFRDQLNEFSLECELNGLDATLNLEHYIFFTNDFTLHGNTLYIVTEQYSNNLALTDIEKGAAIIYIGSYAPDISSTKCSWIYVGNADPYIIANRVNEIFEKYARIDNLLNKVIFTGTGLQKIVELSTPLFENEITVRDKSHRYIAHSYKKILFSDNAIDMQPDHNGYASKDEINQLQFNKNYQEECPATEPWIYRWEGCSLLCLDIFIREKFLYRIKISDIKHPFRSYDAPLLKYMANIITENHISAMTRNDPTVSQMASFWSNLIDCKSIPDVDIKSKLQELGWNLQDDYLVVYAMAGANNGEIKAYSYYCRFIFHHYRHTFAIQYADGIVVIVNLARGYNKNAADFSSVFAEFLREENFRAGISMTFSPLTEIPFFYKQAELALKYGSTDDPEIWSYHFAAYRHHYLLEHITGDFSGCAHFIPELHRLKENDAKNGTEYIKTLAAYYQCGRNQSRAAKQLILHRSTLIYRLQKISEILHVDLDANDTACLFELFLYMDEKYKGVL